MIEIGNITIDELEQVSVIDVVIEACANEHGTCRIKARTSQSDVVSSHLSTLKTLTLTETQNGETIFTGVPASFKIKGSELSIELISNSCTYDAKKDSAVFQDTSLTYLHVVEEVASKENIAAYKSDKLDIGIGMPVYRYEETAWQFFKRIAGMAAVPIIAKYNVLNYSMSVGLTDERKTFPEEQLAFHEGIENGIEFLAVKGYANLAVGDKVLYNGFEYAVKSVHATAEKGILLFEYTFVHTDALMAEYETNQALCGLTLFGTVNKSETDHILVDFDIDKGSNRTASYQYPWKTIASNMLYCMPEEESRVAVNLFDAAGTSSSAVTCMRTEKPEFAKSDKVFEVANGKKLSLTSKSLQFFSPVGEEQSQQIELGNGISVNSFKNINIENVLENITVSGVTVEQTSPNEIIIEMGCDVPEAEIALRATVEIDGENVVIKAVERTSYNQIDDAPTEIVLDGKKLLKLGLKILAMVAVVAVACVVAVALAPATAATAAVVGGVIKACALGGAAFMGATLISQTWKDGKMGIERSGWEYLYQAVDSFCTGAMMSAPMAIFPPLSGASRLDKFIVFGKEMGISAGVSWLYQMIDSELDDKFGADFYDVDSSMGLNIIFDVACNGFGKGIGCVLDDAFAIIGKYYKTNYRPYLNIAGRTGARQHLYKTMGPDAMKYYGELLDDIARQNKLFEQGLGKIKDLFSLMPNTANNYLFGLPDKNPQEYEEIEFKQYFKFNEGGELVWE